MNDDRETPRRARDELLPVLFLLVLLLLFFWDTLLGDRALVTSNMLRWLPWRASASIEDLQRPSFRDDAAETYFPRRFFSQEEIRAGRIPLWNPGILCGAPHLADLQSAVFHPLNLLLYSVDPRRAMGIFVAVHLLLGGWFLYLLLRGFRVGAAGSLLGAVAFVFNAYFATYLGHPTHIATGCWIPLLFLLSKRFLEGGGGRLLPAAVALAFLGGFPQTMLYGLLALAAFVLFAGAGSPAGERRRRFVRVAALGGLVLVGFGLVLFQILPTAELGSLSERKEVPLSIILAEHKPGPWSLLRPFLPDFFGNPVDETFWLAALDGPLSHPSDLGFIGYAGVVPLLLALSALVLSRKREVRFFAALAAAALLLAFSGPIYSLFYRLLPFARFSSGLHRLQFPFLFSIAVLAGFGFEEVRSRLESGRARAAARILGAWLLLLPIGAAALHWGGPRLHEGTSERLARVEGELGGSERNPLALSPVARGLLAGGSNAWLRHEWRGFGRFALFLAAGAGALFALLGGRRWTRAAGAAVLLVVAADGWTFARTYYTPQPASALFAPHASLDALTNEEEPFRVARFTWEYLLPSNTGLPYGIEDLQGVNALMPRDYGDLFAAIDPMLCPDGRRIASFRSAAQVALPLWDLLGVRSFLLSPPRFGTDAGALEAEGRLAEIGGFRVVSRDPFTRIDNLDALPRAFLRHAYRVERDRGRILREVTSPGFDPQGPLWLEEDPGIENGGSAPFLGGEVRIIERESSMLRLRTRSERPALLFVSETYFPGWEVSIDGAKGRILRAHYAFRAVPLAEGEHEVVFHYRPRSFRNGVLGSALAFIVYAFVILARRRVPGGRREISR